MNTDSIKRFPVLSFFEYEHLPPVLKAISQPNAELAERMADLLSASASPAEVAAGLRKLLEAKDCFVRAGLPVPGKPIKP